MGTFRNIIKALQDIRQASTLNSARRNPDSVSQHGNHHQIE